MARFPIGGTGDLESASFHGRLPIGRTGDLESASFDGRLPIGGTGDLESASFHGRLPIGRTGDLELDSFHGRLPIGGTPSTHIQTYSFFSFFFFLTTAECPPACSLATILQPHVRNTDVCSRETSQFCFSTHLQVG